MRVWNKYSETQQSWSTMPIVVMRIPTAMRRRIRWKFPESNHHHTHNASSDTESDQLDWDPERIDDDGYPLVDENGSTLIPVPREGPLEEDEASSLTELGRKDTGKFGRFCVIRSRDVVTINPSQAVTRKLCAKLCSKRNHRDEIETSALHSETKREIFAQNVSLDPS